jgi:GntR family transcriptional regulator
MEIDRYSEIPPWRQLADELRRMIESGQIQPHRAIPSKRTAMQTWGIAGATYDKAVNLLKVEGLVHTVIGMGVYVVER